jgi:hypothetical protein
MLGNSRENGVIWAILSFTRTYVHCLHSWLIICREEMALQRSSANRPEAKHKMRLFCDERSGGMSRAKEIVIVLEAANIADRVAEPPTTQTSVWRVRQPAVPIGSPS